MIEHAWMTANFQRSKKLPNLAQVLNTKPADKKKLSKEELQEEWNALQDDFDL